MKDRDLDVGITSVLRRYCVGIFAVEGVGKCGARYAAPQHLAMVKKALTLRARITRHRQMPYGAATETTAWGTRRNGADSMGAGRWADPLHPYIGVPFGIHFERADLHGLMDMSGVLEWD
ncbi:MAG: hypothetical protein AAFW87_10085 [Pseudomonadota bacterium]